MIDMKVVGPEGLADGELLFDGWEKQCFGQSFDDRGACCAIGWLGLRLGVYKGRPEQSALQWGEIESHPFVAPIINVLRALLPGHENDLIIDANDKLSYTPEQFRQLERKARYGGAE